MKRIIVILLSSVLSVCLFSSCGKKPEIKTEYYKQAIETLVVNYVKKHEIDQKIMDWYSTEENPNEKLTVYIRPYKVGMDESGWELVLNDCQKNDPEYQFVYLNSDETYDTSHPYFYVEIFDEYWETEQKNEYYLQTKFTTSFCESEFLSGTQIKFAHKYDGKQWVEVETRPPTVEEITDEAIKAYLEWDDFYHEWRVEAYKQTPWEFFGID